MSEEWSFESEIEYDTINPECFGKYGEGKIDCSICPHQDGCFRLSIPDAENATGGSLDTPPIKN